MAARGWAANSINARVRLTADNDQLKQEVQLLREELRIKDARTARIHPRHRPQYHQKGTARAGPAVSKSDPGLALFDEHGNDRVELYAAKSGSWLAPHDAQGKARASLDVLLDAPNLALHDARGQPVWSAP